MLSTPLRPDDAAADLLPRILVWTISVLAGTAIVLPLVTLRFTSNCGSSPSKSCVANLQQLNSATEQWAMDNRRNAGMRVPLKALVGVAYIKNTPTCRAGGKYPVLLTVGVNPTCSIGDNRTRDPSDDHVLP